MNTNNKTQIDKAMQAFPLWNQLGTEQRAERLTNSLNTLTGDARKMAQWQINNALAQIAAKQLMPGPTGESNLLSNQGRGVFISLITDIHAQREQLFTAVVGQVYAALVAGNSVIHHGEMGQTLLASLDAYLPDGVLQEADQAEHQANLLDIRLAGVCALTDDKNLIEIKQILANKEGLLCQLVSETDFINYSNQTKPSFIHQFTTEQTISTNTTAVGGNATLLELGSKTD
ncbi:1-pyrroline-5-carboxylate dehydrogenase [Marinomonas sp. PE14-40]|uniref:1-pyrroline-5-carboxylate dehydrogenase n=1 Tax=Marinomonas sp. PE14-40 TaxID=3060621 RepID=UPI003F67094D